MRLAKPHKYRAKPCVIDGIRFASQAEGARYQELKLLQHAKLIRDLRLQVEIKICAYDARRIRGREVGKYIADFQYIDAASSNVLVEDVKGFDTPLSRFKRKCVEAQY